MPSYFQLTRIGTEKPETLQNEPPRWEHEFIEAADPQTGRIE